MSKPESEHRSRLIGTLVRVCREFIELHREHDLPPLPTRNEDIWNLLLNPNSELTAKGVDAHVRTLFRTQRILMKSTFMNLTTLGMSKEEIKQAVLAEIHADLY